MIKQTSQLGRMFIVILCILSFLSIGIIRVFCMPSTDRYTRYESNIIEQCETGDGFITVTDDGRTLLEPKGERDSSNFSYYIDGNVMKQIYKSDSKVCVVTWNGEDADYDMYIIK